MDKNLVFLAIFSIAVLVTMTACNQLDEVGTGGAAKSPISKESLTSVQEYNNETNETHFECIQDQCIEVQGIGDDECTYNWECETNEQTPCFDSDHGINYYVQGSVSGESANGSGIVNWTDYCWAGWLFEFYCNSEDLVDTDYYICPDGCDNGICLSNQTNENYSCLDTDSSVYPTINYTKKGFVTVRNSNGEIVDTGIDTCSYDGAFVVESYCEEEGSSHNSHASPHFCECKDGACVVNETNTTYCTDTDSNEYPTINYKAKGVVTIIEDSGTGNAVNYSFGPDRCYSYTNLTEYYCLKESSSEVSTEFYNCPAGEICINGECTSDTENFSCIDTDSSVYPTINYTKKGTITIKYGNQIIDTHTETCSSDQTIWEYYCENENSQTWSKDYYVCEGHCEDGACVVNETNMTCMELGGVVCNEGSTCTGKWITEAKDTDYCCSKKCKKGFLQFILELFNF